VSIHRAAAPAKINLGLFLGPPRASDSRHELVTVMQSISLADEVTLEEAGPGAVADELRCPGVPGPGAENLAARALAAFRERTGWEAPPQRLTVTKRIPLAAGLAGGSADAAAALRLAAHASGLGNRELLLDIAAGLGADVPAQVAPGRWLASGAGERLRSLPAPRERFAVLVQPLASELATGEVYAEADRLGLARSREELAQLYDELGAALASGAPLPAASELLHNDLQRAAVSLYPPIAAALSAVRAGGAVFALVSGSGPTVLGLHGDAAALRAAGEAARAADETLPAAILAHPVGEDFAAPDTLPPARRTSDRPGG
jgi:4-diphosphocytidyl-2-C-methyl-D-erythritol kinase